jgi:hypothetical protein
MSKKLTKQKLKKLISEEEESMTYSVPSDDQNAINKAKEASKTDGVDSTIQLTTEDDDLPEIPDEEKMERGDEYDVTVREDFDKIMEELKASNAPTINIKESINPRIKKRDLIEYIKNKK